MKIPVLLSLLISTTAIAHTTHTHQYKQSGWATWYGPGFYGHKTSSGEIFTGRALTAAHNSLPLGSKARVTYNHRSVIVTINDRGSFGRKYHRLIDLSPRAARSLHMIHAGKVRVTVMAFIKRHIRHGRHRT
jgi:rare lipoprotein A